MIKNFHKNKTHIIDSSKLVTERTLDTVDGVVSKATKNINGYITPIRTSVLTRFPIVFSLLTTFGVATTFLGFEKLVSNISFFEQHPFLMLILGISILAATGTLYKKLS